MTDFRSERQHNLIDFVCATQQLLSGSIWNIHHPLFVVSPFVFIHSNNFKCNIIELNIFSHGRLLSKQVLSDQTTDDSIFGPVFHIGLVDIATFGDNGFFYRLVRRAYSTYRIGIALVLMPDQGTS